MTTESRKIQITGGSTYIVSLPPTWVKANQIKKGSTVTIESLGDSLTLYPNERKKREVVKELEITGNLSNDLLPRTLVSLYISGFDTLVIKSESYISQEIKDIVKKFSRLVMGVEIFEESAKALTLQNVLDSESFPLTTALRRMIMNVNLMLGDTAKALDSMESELMENIIGRDDDVDRYHFYMMKEISIGKYEGKDTIFNLIFSRILERVADHTVNICTILKDSPNFDQKKKSELMQFIMYCYEVFQKATTSFLGADLKTLNEIVNVKTNIIANKAQLMKKKYGDVSYSGIVEEISRIGLYSTDIAEITMDRYVNKNLIIKL
ncbi:MAG: phosphate uptake regulator [Thermoplasmatales archaeon Gpl]|jgi:phosphate uptake regulator|nr:MAG: phosphate uptake regulator [Thermoplasmatales archaeon Gpl]